MNKIIIRKSKKKDCFDIAHIVTIAWDETYRGIINDEFLDNLYSNEELRGQRAFDNFNQRDNHQFVLLFDDKPVGFVKAINSKENEYDEIGEIQALYIIGKYKGYGCGKKLFNTAVEELKKMGYNRMIIGCLKENKSNEFYKHMGGMLIRERDFILPNQTLIENVYLFDI